MRADALGAVVTHHGIRMNVWQGVPSPIKQSHDLVANVELGRAFACFQYFSRGLQPQ